MEVCLIEIVQTRSGRRKHGTHWTMEVGICPIYRARESRHLPYIQGEGSAAHPGQGDVGGNA